jgi:hypothetical protein
MRRFSALAALASTDIAIGFAVQLLVLLTIGVGTQTDAFFAGQAPALVLLAIFQLPIQRAVVSSFAEGKSTVYPAVRLYAAIVAGMAALVAVVCVAGEFALHLIYPTMSRESIDLALEVLKVQGVAVAITAGNLVLLSLNQLSGQFVRCESLLAGSSLLAAVWVVVALDWLGVIAAAYGQVIKAFLSGTGYLLLLRGQLSNQPPPWRRIWEIVRPLASAGMLSKMAPLVDRSIASVAVAGSLTVLVFAQTVYSAAVGVADRALVAPRLPELKRDAGFPKVFRVTWQLVGAGFTIVLALTLAALVSLNVEWVRAAVSPSVLQLLLELCILLAGLPIGTLAAQWLAATLVFVDKAQITARIMTWCFILGIPVKFLGFALGGIQGLAIAMSCYYLASAGSLWLVIRRLARNAPAASREDT